MERLYENEAIKAIQFLLETGPDVWQNIPERSITPAEFAGLAILEDEARHNGVDLNFGEQNWITMRLELAIRELRIHALQFEIWAREAGREDLLISNADLAFAQD